MTKNQSLTTVALLHPPTPQQPTETLVYFSTDKNDPAGVRIYFHVPCAGLTLEMSMYQWADIVIGISRLLPELTTEEGERA